MKRPCAGLITTGTLPFFPGLWPLRPRGSAFAASADIAVTIGYQARFGIVTNMPLLVGDDDTDG